MRQILYKINKFIQKLDSYNFGYKMLMEMILYLIIVQVFILKYVFLDIEFYGLIQ